jgi:hypothetical protein
LGPITFFVKRVIYRVTKWSSLATLHFKRH